MKAASITVYQASSNTSRHFEGTCEIDGLAGYTYSIDVTDNGEPGRNDLLSISLSNGYSRSGALAGGNIQLHNPCPKRMNGPRAYARGPDPAVPDCLRNRNLLKRQERLRHPSRHPITRRLTT
jgi:hypothetical protein